MLRKARLVLLCVTATAVVAVPAQLSLAGVADDAFARSKMSTDMRTAISALDSTPVMTLPVPVVGVSVEELTDTWGDARSAGRSHEGIDIFAERGAAVYSPTDAVVGSIGYGAIGGNYVFTINPGKERFYFAHLDSVKEGLTRGDELSAGDIIGYVGNTGNADHARPHLHFGIYAPKAINPYARLKSTPVVAVPLVQVPSVISTLPNSNLEEGDESALVRELQMYIINHSEGPARDRLARVGSTGYFGSITTNALAELQQREGIYPAAGYYGSITRKTLNKATLLTHFDRDLELGMEGADVLALQKYLNAEGFTIADSGAGSPGNETTYFGKRTQHALMSFQQERDILPSQGYFGPITRAHLAVK